MKLTIDEIGIRKDLYPREKVNQDKVKEYSEYISVLPPVTVNQDNVLVDGFHRYYAHKLVDQAVIEVEIIQTDGDDDLLLKAIELNAKHGLHLTLSEKKKQVLDFYKKLIDDKTVCYDTTRLKKTLSIPDSTFSDWTKNLSDEIEAQRLEKILNLYLKNKTQHEIADEIGITQRQISSKISEIEKNIKILEENPNSEICIKYGFLAEKLQFLEDFNPKLYNVWNTSKNDNEYKHFGNFPIEFMENLLYYYTNPFDLVYDPFGGGGSTIDACKKWFRKYYVSDIKPIELRDDIKQWKIQDGVPKDLSKPDFVFLDPPYWEQAENKYSDSPDDLANIPLDKFYETLETFIKEIKKKMNGGYVAFVISATQKDEREDHAFEVCKLFEKQKFNMVERIILPYSTQQYNGNQVIQTKEKKVMLNLYRDLMIFKKGE